MSIPPIVAKEGTKIGIKAAKSGFKAMFEPIRQWFTKGARKRQGKEVIRPYVIAFMLVSMASGCATVRKGVDNLAIAVDDKFYDSSTAIIALPKGYDIAPYIEDADGVERTIDGWKIKYRIMEVPGHVHKNLKDEVMRGNKAEASSLQQVVEAAVKTQLGMTTAPAQPSGAADAIDKLKAEAAKEGVQ